jgi:hypothetical protein
MEQYKSLYEYLGKAAGAELGKKVAAAASAQKIKLTTQEVSNPKYSGTVLMYPVSFLDSYFNPTIELTAKDTEDDELPF